MLQIFPDKFEHLFCGSEKSHKIPAKIPSQKLKNFTESFCRSTGRNDCLIKARQPISDPLPTPENLLNFCLLSQFSQENRKEPRKIPEFSKSAFPWKCTDKRFSKFGEDNKHKGIRWDTPASGLQPSHGRVSFVLWKCTLSSSLLTPFAFPHRTMRGCGCNHKGCLFRHRA